MGFDVRTHRTLRTRSLIISSFGLRNIGTGSGFETQEVVNLESTSGLSCFALSVNAAVLLLLFEGVSGEIVVLSLVFW